MKFAYHGTTLEGFDHPYNTTALNERAVEIPVAMQFLAGVEGSGLEVGNVLAHYGVHGHRAVDLYEPGAENVDLFDVSDTYDWIVSISTVEHVRWDTAPRDPDGSLAAIRHLQSLLNPGGRMLVTVPMGHQPHLDAALVEGVGTDRACTLVRSGGGWQQTDTVTPKPYGVETRWASSVWIGEFSREGR